MKYNITPRKRSSLSHLSSDITLTTYLIIFNVIFFIFILILSASLDVSKYLALQPINLFQNGYFWTLLTSMFMHAGFFHLFVNMFSLFFIGRFLELLIGKKRFFWLYIFSGIFAGLFFATLSWFFGDSSLGAKIFGSPDTFGVGASGALFAIAGVLAFLTPRNKVYVIMGPLIALILLSILDNFKINTALLSLLNILFTVYLFVSIFSMISFNSSFRKFALPLEIRFWALPLVVIVPLVIVSFFFNMPIGNMAHLGGFMAGAAYGYYLRVRYKRKTKVIADYFSQ